MLYRPEAFEPLADEAWDEERVRAGIRAIVADADDAYGEESLWPAHEWDSWRTPTPLKSLYVGAAGIVWALGELRRRGHAEPRTDLAAAAAGDGRGLEARARLDGRGRASLHKEAGLLSGESGSS